jgi:hypothetical protein
MNRGRLPYLRRLDAFFSTRSLGFRPDWLCVRFMVDVVPLGFLWVWFYYANPYSTIAPYLSITASPPSRCALALTRQRSIRSSVSKLGASSLTLQLAVAQSNQVKPSLRNRRG